MKRFLQIIFPFILLTLVFSNCKKEPGVFYNWYANPVDTNPVPPTATTNEVSFISQKWATLNGSIKAGNRLTTIFFEYEKDTNQVFLTISANPDTLTGNYSTRRSAYITGLTPGTTYYYRVIAKNSLGESYGTMHYFMTLDVDTSKIAFNPDLTYGEISDIEGNVYKTIQIGDQTWMAQNLAVTKYNDGKEIPLIIANSEWSDTLVADAYSWYGNVETKYGALYNWYAVNSEKLCPAGWRVPSDEDWTTLTNHLGGAEVAGGKLKEANLEEEGSIHWTIPNVGASNSSGFTALPGGYRYYSGGYNTIKRHGYWWTSTSNPSNTGIIGRSLYFGYAEIDRPTNLDKRTGASVRCIKK